MRQSLITKPPNEIINRIGKRLGITTGTTKQLGSLTVSSRSPSETQVNSIREQLCQCTKTFGYLQRSMVGQHNTAGSNTDALRHLGSQGNKGRSGHRCQAYCIMVLRKPESLKTKLIYQLGRF